MSFWDRPATEVATDLVSRVLVLGELRAVVREADSFTREENGRSAYKGMLAMAPGSAYCVKVMGHVMLLIVTANGSCVRIRVAQVGGAHCPGPGVVTRELGLRVHKQRGVARTVDDRTFQLELEAA